LLVALQAELMAWYEQSYLILFNENLQIEIVSN